MKLLFGNGRREMVTAHRLIGIPWRRGWQYGLLLSDDHRTFFLGWFREQPFVHIDDDDEEKA